MWTSRSLTSAMRRSRSDCDAVLTAAETAFSHDVLLVPTSSITLYTLSAIRDSFEGTTSTRFARGTVFRGGRDYHHLRSGSHGSTSGTHAQIPSPRSQYVSIGAG